MPHFPNLFLLYGPNTNLGHSSIVFMIECQVGYIMGCLPYLARRGPMEVRPEAMDGLAAGLERAMGRMVWQAGCTSWYKNAAGRVTNNWPRPRPSTGGSPRSPRRRVPLPLTRPGPARGLDGPAQSDESPAEKASDRVH